MSDLRTELALEAAYLVAGEFRFDRVHALARRALERDPIPDAICCLVLETADGEETRGLFCEWLGLDGVAAPDRIAARDTVLRDRCQQVVDGRIQPSDWTCWLGGFYEFDDPAETRRWQPVLDAYYRYDDDWPGRDAVACEQAFLSELREWLAAPSHGS